MSKLPSMTHIIICLDLTDFVSCWNTIFFATEILEVQISSVKPRASVLQQNALSYFQKTFFLNFLVHASFQSVPQYTLDPLKDSSLSGFPLTPSQVHVCVLCSCTWRKFDLSWSSEASQVLKAIMVGLLPFPKIDFEIGMQPVKCNGKQKTKTFVFWRTFEKVFFSNKKKQDI